jgi:hypothetical protein
MGDGFAPGIGGFVPGRDLVDHLSPSIADRRVALVIGNSQYKNSAPVQNPASDATDMAAALRTLGFDVLFKTDLDKHATDLALAEFARMATDAAAALVCLRDGWIHPFITAWTANMSLWAIPVM